MDTAYVYATLGVMIAYFASQVLSRRFDPFAPVWLFLVGYAQVYVIQPLTYREWAIGARGFELVTQANGRALWALILFLAVYHCGIGRLVAPRLPVPPQRWSLPWVNVVGPLLFVWGLFCAVMVVRMQMGDDAEVVTAEEGLLRSFPSMMLLAANLLIVTSRHGGQSRPAYLWSGLGIAAFYVMIWMFNGRRSHALMGVLSALCAYYVSKQKRPSWPVLISTACAAALAVGLALGWRFKQANYEHSPSGFIQFVGDFDTSFVLECLNIKDTNADDGQYVTKETEEYPAYLLMLDTVPNKSDFDYGAPYLRIFSTFIPRIVWQDKPIFGREQWINAWIAGSELKRDETFTGPAIGLLGAAHLNGGAGATAIVMACLALLLRSAYDYFRLYPTSTWVQAFWAVTYFNAWFMVLNDDPMIWFYYNWGFTMLPPLAFFWFVNTRGARTVEPSPSPVPFPA